MVPEACGFIMPPLQRLPSEKGHARNLFPLLELSSKCFTQPFSDKLPLLQFELTNGLPFWNVRM